LFEEEYRFYVHEMLAYYLESSGLVRLASKEEEKVLIALDFKD